MSANPVTPAHELPIWMKQAQRGVDWGALLVIAFSLLAAWSFIIEVNLPATNNTEHYVFQAEDIAQGFREGLFYPRWSPYAIQGYGAPIPHYYPQGAAYFAAVVNILFTNDALAAVRIVYLLCFLIAGSMVYAFVSQRSQSLYGFIAAIAYLFNPYIGMTVPHFLGDLSLMLGLALLPSLLWAVNRVLSREQAIDIFLVAAIVGLIVFTVPRLLPQALFLCLLLMGVHLVQTRNGTRFVWILASLFLGIGYTAFYWLPALIELESVQWQAPIIEAAPQFIKLPDLFLQVPILDSGYLLYETSFYLGWGLGIVVILGCLAMLIHRQESNFHFAFLLYGLVLLLGLVTVPSATELIVSISLALAIAGAYSGRLLRGWLGNFGMFLLIFALITLAFPYWTFPSPALAVDTTDAQSQIAYEKAGYGIAVLPAGWAIPSNLPPNPASGFDTALNQLNRIPVSNGEVSLLEESAYSALYQVISNTASRLVYRRTYFAGWQAEIDGNVIGLSPAENGFIALDIPANRNTTMRIFFAPTGIRLFAWGLSLAAVFIVAALCWLRWRDLRGDFDQSTLLNRHQISIASLVLIISFALHVFPMNWLIPDLDPVPRASLSTALYVRSDIDSRFQLLAFEMPTISYQVGDTIPLILYWEISRPILEQYQVRVRLVASDGRALYTSPYTHPAYFPTNRWARGYVVPQSYALYLSESVTAGNYQIVIDAVRCDGLCDNGEADAASPTITLTLPRAISIK